MVESEEGTNLSREYRRWLSGAQRLFLFQHLCPQLGIVWGFTADTPDSRLVEQPIISFLIRSKNSKIQQAEILNAMMVVPHVRLGCLSLDGMPAMVPDGHLSRPLYKRSRRNAKGNDYFKLLSMSMRSPPEF